MCSGALGGDNSGFAALSVVMGGRFGGARGVPASGNDRVPGVHCGRGVRGVGHHAGMDSACARAAAGVFVRSFVLCADQFAASNRRADDAPEQSDPCKWDRKGVWDGESVAERSL